MQTIEVKARFSADGNIQPLTINWRGQEYPIASTGRQWQTEDGLHFLVMIPTGRAFEIRFSPAELRWYLIKTQPSQQMG